MVMNGVLVLNFEIISVVYYLHYTHLIYIR